MSTLTARTSLASGFKLHPERRHDGFLASKFGIKEVDGNPRDGFVARICEGVY